MAEELQGGKSPDVSPASGAVGDVTPNTGGNPDVSPASKDRSEFIPRERFDQVLESTKALEAKVAELESKNKQSDSGQRSWQQVPEQDLQYIATHSSEYPEHATGALSELRRRDREVLKSEILGEVGMTEFKSTNNEAFDANTPLGREVSKIMASNRSQKEVLADVVELAKHRLGGNKSATDARKQLVQNMQAAGVSTPGADSQTQVSPPSFMTMPKDDFRKYVDSIRLGEFKK